MATHMYDKKSDQGFVLVVSKVELIKTARQEIKREKAKTL